jgi:hypothetical protein
VRLRDGDAMKGSVELAIADAAERAELERLIWRTRT